MRVLKSKLADRTTQNGNLGTNEEHRAQVVADPEEMALSRPTQVTRFGCTELPELF